MSLPVGLSVGPGESLLHVLLEEEDVCPLLKVSVRGSIHLFSPNRHFELEPELLLLEPTFLSAPGPASTVLVVKKFLNL